MQGEANMHKLMTEKETAVMVGMSVHWLRRKRWEGGGIPFVKLSERGAVRYAEETVAQYIDAHFRISTSDTGENIRAQSAMVSLPEE
jgi:hypothetical protein